MVRGAQRGEAGMIRSSLRAASRQEAAGLQGAASARLERKDPVRFALSSAGAFPALGVQDAGACPGCRKRGLRGSSRGPGGGTGTVPPGLWSRC